MPPLLDLTAVSGGRAPAGNPSGGGARSRTAPQVRMDRVPAADDTDTATRQTVEMMCQYIRAASADPFVKKCADYAWRRFGMASPDLALKAWGVYWWVKHCIKFRLDEATMFRIGEQNQQDFLLSPSVLFRMKNPAEDCDGFTMAEAALLTCLGVPVVIATVAADPDDRTRWSHVFPVSIINGRPLPLDASHGTGPGWMVPPKHIFRWQAWGLDGKPVDVKPMHFQGLHNYVGVGAAARPVVGRGRWVRRRGVGDLCSDFGVGCDVAPPPDAGPYLQDSTPLYAPGGPLSSTPASSTGIWSFLTGLVGNAASVAKVATTPTTSVTYNPNGTYTVSGPAGSVPAASALSSSSLLPILGVGLFGLVALSMMGKK